MAIKLGSSEHTMKSIPQFTSLPPILSFFSGAGFLDLGIILAGFRMVWCLELNPHISYAHDYGMEHYFHSEGFLERPPLINCMDDIQKTKPMVIIQQAFGTKSSEDNFGIIGGPPCPDFSVGGKNLGEQGEHGRLTHVFCERICELQPSFFLIENVKGLLRTGKHREFLNSEIINLEKHGYSIDLAILNALDLGIPQNRERIFIVGIKRNSYKKKWSNSPKEGQRNWFPWPRDSRYEGAKSRFNWPTTNPFGSTPPVPTGIPHELFVGPLLLDQEEIQKLPNGEDGFKPHSDKFYWIPEGADSRKSFKRLHRYRYSPTAAYGNNEVHLHPALPRRLTVREALRIQSVPDTFALPPEISLSSKFKLTGNGVPVKLAESVGVALARFLREKDL